MPIRLYLALIMSLLLVGCDKWMGTESQISKAPQQNAGVAIDYSNPLLQPSKGWGKARVVENESYSRYQLHSGGVGQMFRLDAQTEQISLVTSKGITRLPDDLTIQLQIGVVYKLENGESAVYEGEQKLETDKQKILGAILKKYPKD